LASPVPMSNLLTRIAHHARLAYATPLPPQALAQRREALFKLVHEVDLKQHLGFVRPEVPREEIPGKGPIIRYMHIFEDDVISMGIFLLPKGASIPLHDHPQMTVASQLLWGSIKVNSYDWVRKDRHFASPDGQDYNLARLTLSEQVSAPQFLVLTAEENNLHEFEAMSDEGAAFFDVLCPPYNFEEDRDCTYYQCVDFNDTSLEALLREIPQPPSLVISRATYMGEEVLLS